MKLIPSLGEISNKAISGFKRFPVTLLWAISGTFFTIWFIDQKITHDLEFNYIKIILTFILGVSWLIATRFIIHYFKEEKSKNKSWLIIFPLLFLLVYYWFLPNDTNSFDNLVIPYRFALLFVSGHLFVFFSPFLFTWNKTAYWNYLKTVFISVARSFLFSIVLYLGLVLALLALKYLFKVDINGDIYFELFIFCIGIVNTWIFLSDFPKNIHQQTSIDYPKALEVFVKYILIPLTILYLIILYAYSFKILLKWDLPKGWVSYLVIALSILGFIIHILINPIRKTINSKTIKRFYPWFYYLLLPMIALLFIAIFRRISQYGITENRYLVLILSFWVLAMTLYILFSKRKKLRYLPMSIAIITLLVSLGPWGLFSVSKNSQAKQFKKLYSKIKAIDFNITGDESTQFKSITRYLVERNAMNKVSDVLGYNPIKVFENASKWNIATKLSDSLGIKITDVNLDKNTDGNYYFNSNEEETFDIKDYDFFSQIYFTGRKNKYRDERNKIKNYTIDLGKENSSILILKEKDTLHKLELKSFLESLIISNNENKLVQLTGNRGMNDYPMDANDLTLENEFADLKIKIIFLNLSISTKIDQKEIPVEITHAGAYVLLKEKSN